MKIFTTAPAGNEIAQYVGVDYLKFSIALIEEVSPTNSAAEIALPKW